MVDSIPPYYRFFEDEIMVVNPNRLLSVWLQTVYGVFDVVHRAWCSSELNKGLVSGREMVSSICGGIYL